jgi:hypothetical protein
MQQAQAPSQLTPIAQAAQSATTPRVNIPGLVKRLQRLKTLRQPHEVVWRDCFDHSFPIRGSGLQGSMPMDAQQAADRKARLLHSAATDAGRTLAAALVSGATPSSRVGPARCERIRRGRQALAGRRGQAAARRDPRGHVRRCRHRVHV